MSTTETSGAQRFTTPSIDSDDLPQHIDNLLDDTHRAILGEADGWEWSVETLALEQVTIDSELTPEQNAAQRERSRAIARTKLNMCEAPPLVVITADNILLEGHSRMNYLRELEDSHAVVYHGSPL